MQCWTPSIEFLPTVGRGEVLVRLGVGVQHEHTLARGRVVIEGAARTLLFIETFDCATDNAGYLQYTANVSTWNSGALHVADH